MCGEPHGLLHISFHLGKYLTFSTSKYEDISQSNKIGKLETGADKRGRWQGGNFPPEPGYL